MTRALLRQCLFFLLLITAGLVSQAQVNTANLSGLVTDPTGAVLAHVTVAVTNRATGYNRTVSTDGAGLYSFQDLPIGQYSLSGQRGGIRSINEKVILTVGQRAREDFHLQVGSAQQTVQVQAAAPVLSPDDASISTVIGSTPSSRLRFTCATGTICCASFPVFRSPVIPSRAAPPRPAASAISM